MNLADYLSELLGQYDEVSVPGLGYFVREHISAYYSESDARFYPPYHRVKFVPEPKDDDIFAQYVADKKNISLASSKYFAEKFVAKLREDAAKSKFLFSDLGSFRIEQNQLVFSPNEKIAADPSYYGYPPVSIYKQGQPIFGEPTKAAFIPTPAAPVVVTAPQPVHTVLKQQYFEEETERKRPVNIWLVILIIIAVLAIAGFGVYTFYPSVFNKVTEQFYKLTGKQKIRTDSLEKAKADSLKKVKANVALKTVAAADTSKQSTWIIVESDYATRHEAEKARNWLINKKKIKAEVRDAPLGPRVQVTVGSFPTFAKADSAMAVMFNAGQISKKSEIEEVKQ